MAIRREEERRLEEELLAARRPSGAAVFWVGLQPLTPKSRRLDLNGGRDMLVASSKSHPIARNSM